MGMSEQNKKLFDSIMYVFSSGESDGISPIMLQADLEMLFVVSLEKIFRAQEISDPNIDRFDQTEIFMLMTDEESCRKIMKSALKNPKLDKKFECSEFVKDADLITKCKRHLEQKILTALDLRKEFDDDGMHQFFHVPEVKIIRELIDFLFAIGFRMKDSKMASFTAHIYISVIEVLMKYLKLQKIDCKKVSGGIAIYQNAQSMYEDKTVIISASVDFIKSRLGISQFPFEIDAVAVLEKTDVDSNEQLSERDKMTLERIEAVAMHAKITKGKVMFSEGVA